MYYILALLFCTTCFAGAKIEIVPSCEAELKKRFLSQEEQRDPMISGWDRAWSYLHDRAVENRGEIIFTDLKAVPKKLSKIKRSLPWTQLKQDSDWIITWNMPGFVHSGKIKVLPMKKLAIFLLEPPTVIETQYSPEITKHFAKVFTWRDDIVDGKKFIKFYHPVLRPATEPVPFNERKLSCMFCANKSSPYKYELYSKRRAIIHHLDTSGDLDLYGPGWEKENLQCHKGYVDDKVEAARYYRFTYCLENTANVPGYITEKIFDAFSSLSVPIYQGAPNVTDEIPANCFIDITQFKSLEELNTYLKNMSEKEFETYITNIQNYLKSPQAQRFSSENFAALLEREFLSN